MATSKAFPPLTEEQQIEPDRIASVLGCDPAQIKRIEVVHKSATITSTIRRVKITYAKVACDLPSTIFVKHGRPGIGDKFLGLGRHEVRFFSELLGRLPERDALSVPHCYEAAHDMESGDWHLIREDLDGTHFVTQWPVPPTLSYCEMAVDCLATMHAKLWDHPQLGLFGELPPARISEAEMRERLSESFANVDPFLDFLQDRISARRNQLFRRVIHALPSIWVNRNARRPTGQPGYSLVHGDAHFWNFMYPKNPDTAPVYLIDWQGYEVSVPLIDLAYMIALHWYPERRARFERPLVLRYHDRLLSAGVEDYPWEECWEDYRRSTLTMFLTPMFFWAADLHAAIWWPHLERICLAYDDLACGELLE